MTPVSPSLPKGWPGTINYIETPTWSNGMTSELRILLNAPPVSARSNCIKRSQVPRSPSALVKITPISDQNHPAYKEFGLFASKALSPESLVLFYVGWIHTQSESDGTSDYDLSLDRELGIGIDASNSGNEARFINDYRGIGSSPNAEFRDIWIESASGKFERRMGVFVLPAGKSGKRAKGIARGEEILVSYGKGFWKERMATEQNEHGSEGQRA
jgi:hypothetical protein